MAKKSLIDAAASKLVLQEEGRDSPRVLLPRKRQRLPKSFRLGAVDIERLRRLCERLGQEAGRPISETEAIKGVLLLGEKTDPKKVLAAIKDAVFESK